MIFLWGTMAKTMQSLAMVEKMENSQQNQPSFLFQLKALGRVVLNAHYRSKHSLEAFVRFMTSNHRPRTVLNNS
jgi:hypothetical protein